MFSNPHPHNLHAMNILVEYNALQCIVKRSVFEGKLFNKSLEEMILNWNICANSKIIPQEKKALLCL